MMTKQDNIAISVNNVSKAFILPHEKRTSVKGLFLSMFRGKRSYERQQVLRDVTFDIKKGEFFGIVGRNGSGKSTLLKLLAGIYTPDKGRIQVNGKLTPFIELGVGFNPELTGRENVFLNGALLGFNRREMEAMYDEIVEFAELEKFMDQKLKNYSSGMQVRLAFSIAIRAKGDILVLDEVLAVGDYDFQQKCFEYFKLLMKEKRTVILVTHDMNNVQKFCSKAIHIQDGEVVSQGAPKDIIKSYRLENMDRAELGGTKSTYQNIGGTGDVSIVDVGARSVNGKLKTAFSPMDMIRIDFKVVAHKDIKSPVFGMVISDGTGRVVFATNTLDKGQKTNNLISGKTYNVSYTLKNIFDDGSYTISGAVASSDRMDLYARVESAARFRSVGWDMTAKSSHYIDHEIKLTPTDQ